MIVLKGLFVFSKPFSKPYFSLSSIWVITGILSAVSLLLFLLQVWAVCSAFHGVFRSFLVVLYPAFGTSVFNPTGSLLSHFICYSSPLSFYISLLVSLVLCSKLVWILYSFFINYQLLYVDATPTCAWTLGWFCAPGYLLKILKGSYSTNPFSHTSGAHWDIWSVCLPVPKLYCWWFIYTKSFQFISNIYMLIGPNTSFS